MLDVRGEQVSLAALQEVMRGIAVRGCGTCLLYLMGSPLEPEWRWRLGVRDESYTGASIEEIVTAALQGRSQAVARAERAKKYKHLRLVK